jgi:hypothetical protein
MTERAGVVPNLAFKAHPHAYDARAPQARPTTIFSAGFATPSYRKSGLRIFGDRDLRGENNVQRPPLAKCIKRSRVARCPKPDCLCPRRLMCGRWFVGTRRNSRAEGANLRRSGRAVQGRKLRRQGSGQRTPGSKHKIRETGLPVLALRLSAPRPRVMVLRSKSATA